MKTELSTWYGRMPEANLDADIIGQFHTVKTLCETVGIMPWKSTDVQDVFDGVRRTVVLGQREMLLNIPKYGMVGLHPMISSPAYKNVHLWGRSTNGCTMESIAICEATGALLCIRPNHGSNIEMLTTLSSLKPYSPIYYFTSATLLKTTVKSPFICLKKADFLKVPPEKRDNCLSIVQYLSGVIEWKLRGYSSPMLYVAGKRRLAVRDLMTVCHTMIGADKLRLQYEETT